MKLIMLVVAMNVITCEDRTQIAFFLWSLITNI